ncbi:MAG: hypothetical protein KA803_12100 [Rhodoferax sp.]|nr:hypothetical protein [Rhodoferax sp.]
MAKLAAIAAESIGWQSLGDSAYLHVCNLDENVIAVVATKGHPLCFCRMWRWRG